MATESLGRGMGRHPNATVALGSGAGLGSMIVWMVGLTGASMPAEVGASLGGLMAAMFLFVGRRGIRGAAVSLWRGEE